MISIKADIWFCSFFFCLFWTKKKKRRNIHDVDVAINKAYTNQNGRVQCFLVKYLQCHIRWLRENIVFLFLCVCVHFDMMYQIGSWKSLHVWCNTFMLNVAFVPCFFFFFRFIRLKFDENVCIYNIFDCNRKPLKPNMMMMTFSCSFHLTKNAVRNETRCVKPQKFYISQNEFHHNRASIKSRNNFGLENCINFENYFQHSNVCHISAIKKKKKETKDWTKTLIQL